MENSYGYGRKSGDPLPGCRGTGLLFVALKDQFLVCGNGAIKGITLSIKGGELLRACEALLDNVTAHQTARFFGIEVALS